MIGNEFILPPGQKGLLEAEEDVEPEPLRFGVAAEL
jgi:hypothetical protein